MKIIGYNNIPICQQAVNKDHKFLIVAQVNMTAVVYAMLRVQSNTQLCNIWWITWGHRNKKKHRKEAWKNGKHQKQILNLFSLSVYVSGLSSNHSYLHWRLGINSNRISMRRGVLHTEKLAGVVVGKSDAYNLYSHG